MGHLVSIRNRSHSKKGLSGGLSSNLTPSGFLKYLMHLKGQLNELLPFFVVSKQQQHVNKNHDSCGAVHTTRQET